MAAVTSIDVSAVTPQGVTLTFNGGTAYAFTGAQVADLYKIMKAAMSENAVNLPSHTNATITAPARWGQKG